jgi:hypothetical protein
LDVIIVTNPAHKVACESTILEKEQGSSDLVVIKKLDPDESSSAPFSQDLDKRREVGFFISFLFSFWWYWRLNSGL